MSRQAADVESLRAVEVAEEQAWMAKDLEKTLGFYADDVVILGEGGPPLVGKAQLRESMKADFADSTSIDSDYRITAADVAQSGDIGYTVGTNSYTHAGVRAGQPVTDHEKWLTVRKKQADGSWKIVYDTFSSDAKGVVSQNDEAEIRALELAWVDADRHKDPTPLRRILSTDWRGTDLKGEVVGREKLFADIRAETDVIITERVTDVAIRRFGNTAVVTGVIDEQGKSDGKPYTTATRFTDVVVLLEGRWQVVASQSTKAR